MSGPDAWHVGIFGERQLDEQIKLNTPLEHFTDVRKKGKFENDTVGDNFDMEFDAVIVKLEGDIKIEQD